MSAINGMKQFQTYFGMSSGAGKTCRQILALRDPAATNFTRLSAIVFGIYTIGGVAAALPGSYLPDKIGRRWTMVAGNTVLL
jgi:MFS family permease